MKLNVLRESCDCSICIGACKSVPGWFLPGQVEKVADYLKITLQELFDQYLGVNWFVNLDDTGDDTFVLAPASVEMTPGTEYPGDPTGQCVFLDENERCKIHEVKPYECQMMLHTDGGPMYHVDVARKWVDHQDEIKDLLGREPNSVFSFTDMFSMMLRNLPVNINQ